MTNVKLAVATALAAIAFGVLSGTVSHALSNRAESPVTIVRGLGGVPTSVQKVFASGESKRTEDAFDYGEYIEVICTTPSHMRMGDKKVAATYDDKLIAPNAPVIYNTGSSAYISFVSREKGYCWVTTLR